MIKVMIFCFIPAHIIIKDRLVSNLAVVWLHSVDMLISCVTWPCCFAVSGAVDLRLLLPTGLPDGDAAELCP